eukprot:scaffold2447_cov110-Cylindrotheca_fusiformis.AAC.15
MAAAANQGKAITATSTSANSWDHAMRCDSNGQSSSQYYRETPAPIAASVPLNLERQLVFVQNQL